MEICDLIYNFKFWQKCFENNWKKLIIINDSQIKSNLYNDILYI